MKCNWCGQGEGSNRVTDRKTNKIMYYYCSDCIGSINREFSSFSEVLIDLNYLIKIKSNKSEIKRLIEKYKILREIAIKKLNNKQSMIKKILNARNFEEIIIHRCFKGWDKIKDKYFYPNNDGDILLLIHKDSYVDIKDVKTIINYLYKKKNDI